MGGTLMPKRGPSAMGDEKALHLVQLLREYSEKLRNFQSSSSSERARSNPEYNRLDVDRFMRRMFPAIKELSGMSSQFIEYGSVDDVTRIELRLRLVELEHA